MTQWTITKDLISINEGRKFVGTIGPHNATMTHDEIINHPNRKAFRMYDDDNELYYEGFLVGDNEFAPLDDFGTPNDGCTSIKVKEGNKWVTV